VAAADGKRIADCWLLIEEVDAFQSAISDQPSAIRPLLNQQSAIFPALSIQLPAVRIDGEQPA
jgi:hypothetical protein